jgi:hypothetical protein
MWHALPSHKFYIPEFWHDKIESTGQVRLSHATLNDTDTSALREFLDKYHYCLQKTNGGALIKKMD